LNLSIEFHNRELEATGARESDESRNGYADDGGQQAEPEQNQEPFHGESPSTPPIPL
jgi:hypothetical protein